MCQSITTFYACGCNGGTITSKCGRNLRSCQPALAKPQVKRLTKKCDAHTHPMFRPNPFASPPTLSRSNAIHRPDPRSRPSIGERAPPSAYLNNAHNPRYPTIAGPSQRPEPISVQRGPARSIHISGPPPLPVPPRSSSLQATSFPPRVDSLTSRSKPLKPKSPLRPTFAGINKPNAPSPLSLFPPRTSSLANNHSSRVAAPRRSPRLYPTINQHPNDLVFDSQAVFEARRQLAGNVRRTAPLRQTSTSHTFAGDEGRRKAEEWARKKAEIRKKELGSEVWRQAQREAREMSKTSEKARKYEERLTKKGKKGKDCVVM